MTQQSAIQKQQLSDEADLAVHDQIAIPPLRKDTSERKKCRLMLFTDSFIHGGTERQLVEVLHQIDRSRYDTIVGCLKKRGPFLPEVESLDIPIVEFPIRSLHDLTTLREVRKLVFFLKENKVDVVHSFDFYSNAFAAPAARFSRIPVVITSLREIVSQRRLSHRWISRLAARAAHCVVANSQAAAKA